MGCSLISTFIWASSDHDAGRVFLERYKGLGTVVIDSVTDMTPPQWMDMSKDFGVYGVYNGIRSLNLSRLSDDFLDILAKYVEQMPTAGAELVFMH